MTECQSVERLCECGLAVEGHCWNFDAPQGGGSVRTGLLPTEPVAVDGLS